MITSCFRTVIVLVLLLELPQCQSKKNSDTALCESQISAGARLEYEAVMARVFPLHRDAVSWDSVKYTQYTKIVVSGPQRSGTTFFAKALARYLGYEHWDEDRVGNITTEDGRTLTLDTFTPMHVLLQDAHKRRMVLQRPTESHKIHTFPKSPEVFVAFLARNCLDVFRSQNRIKTKGQREVEDTGWTCKFGRKIEWNHYHSDPVLRRHIDNEHDMICTIKQQVYHSYQRGEMHRRGIATMPIAYDSFDTLGQFITNASQRAHLGNKEMTFR